MLIEDEAQYRQSVKMLKEWRERIAEDKRRLKEAGYTLEEIKCVTDPSVSFSLGIADDIEYYESQKIVESENA